MAEVSVIIPSRRERFLDRTIGEVQTKLRSDFEIVVTLDGGWAEPLAGVTYIHNPEPRGMRTAINQAVALASGEYLLKLDAHCIVDLAIDLALLAAHQPRWVQVPRRKRMDANAWTLVEGGRPDVDYMYLDHKLMGHPDNQRNADLELKAKPIDDTEIFQGSCYFIRRDYFLSLGLLDDQGFGGSGREAQEIAFKVRADGGRVVVNKQTWYAHAHIGRHYARDPEQIQKSAEALRELARR